MTSHTLRTETARGRVVLMVAMRIVGAALLLGMAWIHWYLWAYSEYDTVPVIGPLFLINAIVGAVLAIAVCAVPARLLGVTAGLSSLFVLGTFGALIVSMVWGLFGLQETVQGPLVPTTLWVEPLGFVVLGILAGLAVRFDGLLSWLPGKAD